jgi:hypothetical protein
MVGLSTGLHGAGGFGKTTLAERWCALAVRRQMPGVTGWEPLGTCWLPRSIAASPVR